MFGDIEKIYDEAGNGGNGLVPFLREASLCYKSANKLYCKYEHTLCNGDFRHIPCKYRP